MEAKDGDGQDAGALSAYSRCADGEQDSCIFSTSNGLSLLVFRTALVTLLRHSEDIPALASAGRSRSNPNSHATSGTDGAKGSNAGGTSLLYMCQSAPPYYPHQTALQSYAALSV